MFNIIQKINEIVKKSEQFLRDRIDYLDKRDDKLTESVRELQRDIELIHDYLGVQIQEIKSKSSWGGVSIKLIKKVNLKK